jgi:hypothetical protein
MSTVTAMPEHLEGRTGTVHPTTSPQPKIDNRAKGPARSRAEPLAESIHWTASRVLAAIGVALATIGVAGTMALVAITFQSAFLRTVLPQQLQQVKIITGDIIDLPVLAPLVLELAAWVLTAITVALVMHRLPYQRWHRAMWAISLFVSATNGLHIADLTGNVSVGLAYGAISVAGPALIHYFVLFLILLRSGTSVRDSLSQAGSSFSRAVRIVGAVLMFLLDVVLHPVITARAISRWRGVRAYSFTDAWDSAALSYYERLDARHRGTYRGMWTRLATRGSRTTAPARPEGPDTDVTRFAPDPAAAPPRPDSGIANPDLPGVRTGVLTAVRADDPNRAPHDETHDVRPPIVQPPLDRDQVIARFRDIVQGIESDTDERADGGDRTKPVGHRAYRAERAARSRRKARENNKPTNTHTTNTQTTLSSSENKDTVLSKADRIARKYFAMLKAGEDVRNVNRTAIAQEMDIDSSTVRRYWGECLDGRRSCPDENSRTEDRTVN